MLDPRLISTVPVLCVLACTARYPEVREEPEALAISEDLDAPPATPQPRAPRRGASATSEGTAPVGDAGLVGSGGSTSLADRGGYSGSRGFENFGGRGTRVPSVRQARPEVVGAPGKDLIRRSVGTHIPEVRRCYDAALARDPNAKGRVTIAFEIDGKGKVLTTSVQESTMKEPTASDCIAAAVAGWKFPKPRTGTVTVVYPFVLEPG